MTIVFCGSKKSLASGLPMATVLLAGQEVGLIVLPLMLFHQIQLMVCAALAKRYANAGRRAAAPAPAAKPPGRRRRPTRLLRGRRRARHSVAGRLRCAMLKSGAAFKPSLSRSSLAKNCGRAPARRLARDDDLARPLLAAESE